MPGLRTLRAGAGLLGESETNLLDAQVPVEERGVRLEWLIAFLKAVDKAWQETVRQYDDQARAATHFDGVPDPDPLPFPRNLEPSVPAFLVPHVIKPLTRELQAPLYVLVPPDQRGRPDVFISHTWSNPLIGFAASSLYAIGALGKHPAPTHVWLDVVCYNQHKAEAIADDMKSVIRSIGRLVLPMVNTAPFSRLWCLWELLCAHLTEASILIEEPNTNVHDLGLVAAAFRTEFKSVEQANTTLPQDRRQILEAMVATFGSIDATDEYLRRLILAQLSNDSDKPWNIWRRTRTDLMERVSRAIEQHSGKLTREEVAQTAGLSVERVTDTALGWLRREGYVTTTTGRAGGEVYESVKPYRERDDPQSDQYVDPGRPSAQIK
jgi:hypothetical protein